MALLRRCLDSGILSENKARPLTHSFPVRRALLGIVSMKSAEGMKSVCFVSVSVLVIATALAAARTVEVVEAPEYRGDVAETSRTTIEWRKTGGKRIPSMQSASSQRIGLLDRLQ